MDVVMHLKQAASGGWVVQEWRSGLPWFSVPLSSWLAGVGVVDLGAVFRKVLSEHDHGGLGGGDLGEALAQAALSVLPAVPERTKHDHSGEPMLWCETHQREHVASIPRFTYLCKDCGWGQWYRDQAGEHESATAVSFHHRHETYEVEHTLRALDADSAQWKQRYELGQKTLVAARERADALFERYAEHLEHVRLDAYSMDCIEGECDHRDEDGQPEDLSACPTSQMEVCVDCQEIGGASREPSNWEVYAEWPCDERRARAGATPNLHDLIAEAERWPEPAGVKPAAAPADLISRLAAALTKPERLPSIDPFLEPAEVAALPVGSVVMTETDAEVFGVYEQRVWQKFGGVPEWQFQHPRHDWQSTDGGFVRVGDSERHGAPVFAMSRRVRLLYAPVQFPEGGTER